MDHHNHSHSTETKYSHAFALGIGLNLVYIVIELFYGLIANSSALIADAGHNASDVLGLLLAWFALWLTTRKPNKQFTYGLKRSTILVSILNAMILFVAVGFILYEAINNFQNPEPVKGTQVMVVAGIGFIINALTALLFIKGQKSDLNIKGAFLHMAADAAVSLGVVLAGLGIRYTGAQWIDPVMSLIIAVLILLGTWRLFKDSLILALDGIPPGIDIDKVSGSLLNVKGVESLHELHIRALSTSENALSVHILTKSTHPDQILKEAQQILSETYGILHNSIQIETEGKVVNCEICTTT